MAKKNISARVPPRVADRIDEYGEVWDMNRTDTLTAILENVVDGLSDPEQMEGAGEQDPLKYTYTLELTPENAEHVEESDLDPESAINSVVSIYSGP